jgi:hypothetical protein
MPLSLFPESWLRLSQTPGLTFGLEQAEDVVLADCSCISFAFVVENEGQVKRTWALDVADDGTGLVVHEFDTALSNTTTGACSFRQPCILSLRALQFRPHAPS